MGAAMPVIMQTGQMPQQQPQAIAPQAPQQQQPSTSVGPTVQPFVYRKQGTRIVKPGGTHDKSSSSSTSDVNASDGGEGDNADDHGDDGGDDGGDGGDGGD